MEDQDDEDVIGPTPTVLGCTYGPSTIKTQWRCIHVRSSSAYCASPAKGRTFMRRLIVCQGRHPPARRDTKEKRSSRTTHRRTTHFLGTRQLCQPTQLIPPDILKSRMPLQLCAPQPCRKMWSAPLHHHFLHQFCLDYRFVLLQYANRPSTTKGPDLPHCLHSMRCCQPLRSHSPSSYFSSRSSRSWFQRRTTPCR